jgi:hypothetical protein
MHSKAHISEMAELSDFVHESIQSEGFYPQGLTSRTHVPVVWTVAHRGYSGSGRLDVWVYVDEQTGLRAAAELAMNCGLDEDATATNDFHKGRYQQVIVRYREKSPPSHVLAVQEASLMQNPDTFLGEDIQIGS